MKSLDILFKKKKDLTRAVKFLRYTDGERQNTRNSFCLLLNNSWLILIVEEAVLDSDVFGFSLNW